MDTTYDGSLIDESTQKLQKQLHWIFRVTAALCFIGHGAWGVITKSGWLPFFAVVGIPESIAWKLMPMVGLFDIGMAIVLLFGSRRIVLLWMTGWAVWTALLRPLAGASFFEVWERAGNYGPPFALLLMGGVFSMKAKDWFGKYQEPALKAETVDIIAFVLRASLALLLIGHGGFGVFVQKQMLMNHFASVGLPGTPEFLMWVGMAEIALGVLVFFYHTSIPLLSVILVWKLFTESLYPIAGRFIDVFETIERWGDYGIPVALIAISVWRSQQKGERKEPVPRGVPVTGAKVGQTT